MILPIAQSIASWLSQTQTVWAQKLDPVLKNAILQGTQLTGVKLKNGATTFDHLLSRQMQGWFITDIDAAATVYRSQPFNATSLTLSSNAPATVNLWVY